MEGAHDKSTVPTISRIVGETIVELIYDANAGKTGLVVAREGRHSLQQEFTLPTGETLVPYAPSNNLIRHECVVLASTVTPHGGKQSLLQDIQAFLHRYVDLSPLFEKIAAHYILLSWVFDAFNELPYLRLRGDYGSGKTRALIALGSIAYKGFFASGASTVSPIFHTLDTFGGTLILDEADLRFSDKTSDIVKILNNGTVKGLPVLRTLQNRYKEFNPAAFSVFGPKIIAMRGTFKDDALESRFLSEDMGRRPLRSDIPIQLPASLKAEALVLRNRLLDFRFNYRFTVGTDPGVVIPGIDPRFNQTAISLLSLVDDVDVRAAIGESLRKRQKALSEGRARSAEARTLSAVNELFERSGRQMVPLQDVAAHVQEQDTDMGTDFSTREAGRILREQGMTLRKSHGTIVVAKPAAQPATSFISS